jgi:WD40 repeat protein
MPPEQAGVQRGQIGRASDVYALGAVLFHLLSGRPPFVGQNMAETVHAVVHEDVTPPRLLNPNTPPDLETLCLKCLEKDPSRRYQTAEELAAELNRFLLDEPIQARPVSRSEKVRRWCRRKPAVATLAASLLVVFLAGLTGVLTEWRRVSQKSEENRQQVAQLDVLSGVQLMQSGDYFKALLWFIQGLRTDAGRKDQEEIHRLRIASVLRQCPRLVQVISHDGQPLAGAVFSPTEDRLATIALDRTARVWEIPSGRLLLKTKPLDGLPFAVQFSPDGARLLLVLLDHTVRVLDAATGEPAFSPLPHWLDAPESSTFHPVFDRTGKKLVTQSRTNVLQIWDMSTGQPICPALVHSNLIERAQFNADSSLLFTRTEAWPNLAWNATTGEPVPNPMGTHAAGRFFLSPFSDVALVNGRLWRMPRTRPEVGSEGNLDAVPIGDALLDDAWLNWAAFSPDGVRLITASRTGTARIWDAVTGKPLSPALQHDQDLSSVAFSPDGYRVLSTSWDNVARVWDADSGEPLTPPLPCVPLISGFSSSGRYLLTMHPEYVACVWDLSRDETPPALLKPLTGIGVNASGAQGKLFVSRDPDNLIRIRNSLGGLEVPIHPLSLRSAPAQAWFDETSRFVVLEAELATVQIWEAASGMPITPRVHSRYTLDEAACKRLALPSIDLPIGQLGPLAELLSGNRLDGRGGWRLLKLEDMLSNWELLSRNQNVAAAHRVGQSPDRDGDRAAEGLGGPNILGPSAVSLESWHQREAEAAAAAQDWFAAVFHWEQLEQRQPDESEFRHRRNYAQQSLAHSRQNGRSYSEMRQAVPPRDPQAGQRLIDLTPFYTPSSHGWFTEPRRHFGLGVGIQTLANVRFDIRGVVELFSINDAQRGNLGPEKVSGIRVGQRCAKLHFLHTGGWVNWEKQEIANLVVHYANGQAMAWPIIANVHLSSDWGGAQSQAKDAEIAWVGTNPFANSSQATVRLFKYTWTNPHPDWEISHLDLISAKTKSSYHLIALTAE